MLWWYRFNDWLFGFVKKFKYDIVFEREIWNLNKELINFLLPRIKILKERETGHVSGLSYKEWLKVLDDIIEGLECHKKIVDTANLEKIDEYTKKRTKAFNLINKYFDYLWW